MHFKNDTDLYRIIGTNIKHYRKQAKLTQVQLAEQAKISISYLSKIEAAGCNKSLSISVLNQIANVLDVEIIKFFQEVSTYDTNN
jgi:transcriptional regulator with XRE-family HTH domain